MAQDHKFGSAIFFDGQSSTRRTVELRFGARLEMLESGALIAAWAFDEMRHAGVSPGISRFRCISGPELARLEVINPDGAAAIVQRAHHLDAESGNTVSTLRIVGWSLAAVVSIVCVAIFGIPLAADRIAPLVPAAFEARIGEMVDGQVKAIFGDKTCKGEVGTAALLKLVKALEKQGGLAASPQAGVINSDIPNAFALPGGKVYVLKGLLDKAESPDELAAVLAHELGHVAHRDGMRHLIQTGGTSFLIGLLFGDVTGSGALILVSRQLLDSSHSRGAETAADDFAIDVMNGLGRSPAPLGELLVRIIGEEKATPMSVLASHPVTSERLERAKKAAKPANGPPLLSFGEWRALKSICKQGE